jgi:5S rRNA maturation endonuclease (ribonuclease M5)
MTAPAEIITRIEAALLARDGTRKGDEIEFRCLEHEDNHPSAYFNVAKGCFKCHGCGAKGGWKKLAEALDIETQPNRGEHGRQQKAERRIVATYDYRDENGTLLFQVARFEPKDFRQRRPGDNGEWIWNLEGVRRVLFHTPELTTASTAQLVFVVEGEKDADRLASLGILATCNPMGAGKWLPEHTTQLRGRHVVIIPDADRPGREHAAAIAAQLFGVAASVAVLELTHTTGKDVSDWLDGGGTIERLLQLAGAAEPIRTVPLVELVQTFRRWLHLPDPAALYIVLATVIANRMRGDAVWLMVIAAPGHGKTEAVGALARVAHVFPVATLTESALLSGTAQRVAVGTRPVVCSDRSAISEFSSARTLRRSSLCIGTRARAYWRHCARCTTARGHVGSAPTAGES